ncbi:hypothetical protein [Chondromyces apiculatus]|uniref:hypothetical protein n=1 Tax=Chondromyces apiculatus TaxID=51 RepID=UPI0006946B10|nr:hypothetical protein [Chondromyces apiculatus]
MAVIRGERCIAAGGRVSGEMRFGSGEASGPSPGPERPPDEARGGGACPGWPARLPEGVRGVGVNAEGPAPSSNLPVSEGRETGAEGAPSTRRF